MTTQELKLTRSTDEVRPSGMFSARNIYEIPYFQRPYKWDSERIRQLQNDLLMLVDGQTDVHFLGAVITHSRQRANSTASQRIEVVDGQQRLTTVYLFICAAVRALIEFGDLDNAVQHYINFVIDPFHLPPPDPT